ncbi:UNVERIFIED_ORG: 3-oxoacyl-[acyl-carrier protein] reductase [Pseudomonas parafulva]|uniref:3-oxoacyl-ACP reductase FabG n=1 Tax=Pseudomonas fulva TaxID=47880 RepID=A0A2L1WF91_9PSED|nr:MULTISPECIES: 3-oxoacyl-ACP reductase family protein [Pseudomonas]MCY4126165.1 3-oxoacyl-ACP reductase FabG [Pseudomonas sp.]MDP9555885.1 3-oxoacyl-[acyl-carrier protein] reductase [Pseudomonas parafulva]MDP9663338.1 3-oxoacyl-[acyl-carrier protein] reductase [Pseudomonas cremoricolorata]AVF55976.1 3-oxoacyl-ACP reductase FabG [Pseudomonas fulva]MBA1209490.1 3-oxoacyl-ACP reductase FabG [Pseudomonas fulva]
MSTPVVHAALNFTLTGRTALVTGAARGIGHAIAMALGQAGARVGVCDLDAEAAEAAAARLREVGIEAVGVGADVADEAQVQAMVGQVQAMLGGVDILVNNAGIVSTGPLLEVTTAEWNRVMAIDLNSVFFCAKAVLPGMMARQSGRIINIASVAGKRGGGLLGNSCYAAAKGAVIALTKGLAREAGPYAITVNAVSPALTDTEMTSALAPQARAEVLAQMPLGRAGTPRDIAAAVCFLASREAGFVTGEIMDVDGGFMRD